MTSVATGTVSERLKTETAELHSAAEREPLQVSLIRGGLPREAYAGWLGQMLMVHIELERALSAAMARDARVAAVVTPEQFQEPHVRADLAFYGGDAARLTPLPATQTLIRQISAANAAQLLGFHYVLEGSKNGAMFIGNVLRKVYGLTGQDGLRSLQPYGDQIRPRWAAWKASLDQQAFSPAEQAQMIDAAKGMFRGVQSMSAEFWATRRLGEHAMPGVVVTAGAPHAHHAAPAGHGGGHAAGPAGGSAGVRG